MKHFSKIILLLALICVGLHASGVCDGFTSSTYETEYILITYNGHMDVTPTACFTTVYSESTGGASHTLHMNWGWGGRANGFFNYNDWKVTPGNETWDYSKERKAIVGFK